MTRFSVSFAIQSILVPCLVALHVGVSHGQVETSITEPLEWSRVAVSEHGVLRKIMVKEGARVRQGDLLAELDCGDLEQAKRIAELKANSRSAIAAAEANRKLRQSQNGNLLKLQSQGHANPMEVDQALAQFEQADAELLVAEEEAQRNRVEVERLQALLDRRAVKSPIDGIVIELHKRTGESVSANDPHVVTVVSLNQLRVRFYLKLETIEALQPRQNLTVYVGPRQLPVDGVVDFISPVIEPKSGLSRVDLLIDNRVLGLRSGLSCRWPGAVADESQPGTATSHAKRNRPTTPPKGAQHNATSPGSR